MTNMSKKAVLALTLSISAIAGCSKAPAPTQVPAQPSTVSPADAIVVKDISQVKPANGSTVAPCPQGPWNADCRYIAFTACNGANGSLFLWDNQIQDVYILNGALAGLSPVNESVAGQKHVEGPEDCAMLDELNPQAFADGKVLFSFGRDVYVYDMVAEQRVAVAQDGQALQFGGPRASVTADGHEIAYVSERGTIVLKVLDNNAYTYSRELTKIAAEAQSLNDAHGNGVIYDAQISGDGRWIAVNIDGILYLYDVANPHLFQLLPLSGSALAGEANRIGHVAISYDGRFVAFTTNDRPTTAQAGAVGTTDIRLLVLDRQTGMIDTVPYANLGYSVGGKLAILDPIFCYDGRSLMFEIETESGFRVWKYDLLNESLRGLVTLNNALGETGSQNLVSQTNLN